MNNDHEQEEYLFWKGQREIVTGCKRFTGRKWEVRLGVRLWEKSFISFIISK